MKNKSLIIVILTVLVCSASLSAIGYWLRHHERSVEVAVSYDDSPAKGINQSKSVLQKPDAMNPNGEMYHTARRVREAASILVQATLFDATSRMQGRVPNTVADLSIAPPPGVEKRSVGIFESTDGIYYLRYRVSPMAFEVVAQPKTAGPKLFLRLDPKALDSDGVQYFEASRLSEIEVPPPFAAAATFLGKGWSRQRLQVDPFEASEKQKLIQWARSNG